MTSPEAKPREALAEDIRAQLTRVTSNTLTAGVVSIGVLNRASEAILATADAYARALNAGNDLDEDSAEPYCTVCGEWAGLFRGIEGWRHYRGDPAPGAARELHDAGHAPVIGWTAPPGRAIAPAQARLILAALDDAAESIRERAANCPDCQASPADLCEGCAGRLERADAYDALARQLGTVVARACSVCGEDLSGHIGRKPCIQSGPGPARSLHDLPVFGWAWAEDANGAER